MTDDVKNVLAWENGKTLILTVGNTLRSDDGVGPYIASFLSARPKLEIIDAGFKPENIIEQAVDLDPSKIIVIDAADFRACPGDIRIISQEMIPETTLSSHTIPLNVITQLICQSISAKVVFIGIQVKKVALGEGLCREVRKSADKLVRIIKKIYY